MQKKLRNKIGRNRIYALGLLLSFFVIMISEAKPHFHNEKISFCVEAVGSQLGHCPLECENENDIPAHHHSIAEKAYYFFRSDSLEVEDEVFTNVVCFIIPQNEILSKQPLFINVSRDARTSVFLPEYFPITFNHRGPPSFLF